MKQTEGEAHDETDVGRGGRAARVLDALGRSRPWASRPGVFSGLDDGDIRPLTPEEKQGFQDPFFQLVLKNNPGAVKLSDIEGLLQPDATRRRTFVLDEEI